MNQILEKEVESYLKREVEKANGICLKFTSPGTRGVPDRIVIHDLKTYYIELKRPKGGRLSNLQKYWMREFQKQGYDIHIIKNKEEVDKFVQSYLT